MGAIRKNKYLCSQNQGDMELRQLRYFIKVAELGSFSEASRQLHITQSTISQQIRQLEDELKVELLIRDTHKVVLSDIGREFLPQAIKAMHEVDTCLDKIHDVQELGVGELNIGTTLTFTSLLCETVKQFMRSYPGVKLKLVCASMEDLMKMLDRQEIDLALSFKANEVYPEIESHILFGNSLVVVVDENHPLAMKSSVRLAEIERYPMALPAKGMQARNAFDNITETKDYKLDIRLEINEVNLLVDVIRGTQMVTVLSHATASHMPGIKTIRLEQSNTSMEGSFHVKRGAYCKNATKEFLRLLCKTRPYGLAMMDLL